MSAKLSLSAVAALLLSSAPLLAGGPPRLCLPVHGVTADTADACARRIADALGEKVSEIEVRANGKQWYALFSADADRLTLGQLDAAFKGSPFSIPRDNLRVFGPVVLEVEIDEATAPKLLADLKAVKHLRVDESKREAGVLRVTTATPMTRHFGREALEFGKRPIETELFGVEAYDF